MALTVTPGAADADSYATLTEAATYVTDFRAQASAAWAALDDTGKEVALRQAALHMERIDWSGARASLTQALAWPQYGHDRWGSGEIPRAVKFAQVELAIWLVDNDPTTAETGDQYSSVQIGELKFAFRDPAGRGGVLDAAPDTFHGLLAGLVRASAAGGGGVVSLVR